MSQTSRMHRKFTRRWEGSDVEPLVTVEFESESAGTTRLILTHSRFAQDEERDEHERGWIGWPTPLAWQLLTAFRGHGAPFRFGRCANGGRGRSGAEPRLL